MSLIEVSQTRATAEGPGSADLIAGARGSGEFHCVECGYGIAVRSLLPVCPMCRGLLWDVRDSGSHSRPRV